MNVSITDSCVTFSCGGSVVGEYVIDDPFKPHFRSLKTPKGHETTLVSPGDHRLIKSPWSLEVRDGRKINYHGLGIRLPWMWRFPVDEFCGVEVDGTGCEAMEACGQTAESVGLWGRIDGQWEATTAAVTMSQRPEQAFTWFVLKGDFPYLALGPSNAEERDVAKGEIFEEFYTVRVEDRISD